MSSSPPRSHRCHVQRAAFPWHTGFDALLLRCRLHSQAVARAVERLAHMTRPLVVHHAQGDAVDRSSMLRLAAAWELPVQALRDAVFDPPRSPD